MKVLEIKEAPEGYPGWHALKVEGVDFTILVNSNWFAARIDLGMPQLQVGDEVEFHVRADIYSNPSPFKFVEDFHLKNEGELRNHYNNNS